MIPPQKVGLEPAADPPDVTVRASAGSNGRTARVVPTVAGYDLKGELGRGGMGVVYEARHVRLNRPCALKMILAGAHAGTEDLARFVTEAEAIARLAHPCIVQIRHIGDSEGLPFLELEYVAGGSLDRQLDGTPWPAKRAARLAEQVALGIAEAPSAGYRPSRPQALERAPGGRRHAQGRRLRTGQDAGRAGRLNAERIGHGLAQLHGTRAGPGARQGRRTGRGCVRGGRDPLRAADGPAAVPRHDRPRYARASQDQRASPSLAAGAGHAARHRDDLPQESSEGARQTLRIRPGHSARICDASWTDGRSRRGGPAAWSERGGGVVAIDSSPG